MRNQYGQHVNRDEQIALLDAGEFFEDEHGVLRMGIEGEYPNCQIRNAEVGPYGVYMATTDWRLVAFGSDPDGIREVGINIPQLSTVAWKNVVRTGTPPIYAVIRREVEKQPAYAPDEAHAMLAEVMRILRTEDAI
mgnify:FL=1